jgi:hypothetical protein
MDFNGRRQVVSGRAGGGIRVGQYLGDGQIPMKELFANGGNGPCWTAGGTRCLVDCFDVGLGTCRPDGSDFQTISGESAVTSYGAGVDGVAWASYLAKVGVGIRTSWGLARTDRMWVGMGPGLFVSPQSGDAIECYDIGATSPRWTQPGVWIDFFAVDADRILWTDGARRIQTRGLPPPAQVEAAIAPSWFEALGRSWLCVGRPEGGFVLRHADDASRGFIIVPLGLDAFGPTVVPGDDPDHVIALWSNNPAESAIFATTVDLTSAMSDLTAPVVIPDVPPLNHPVSIGPFKDPYAMTDADSEIVVNGALPSSTRPRWVATDPASLQAFRWIIDLERGLYSEASTPDEIRAAKALAKARQTRILWCHDGTDVDRELLRYLDKWDVPLLECYRTKAETLAQSIARWRANRDALRAAWPNLYALDPMDYAQGGAPPDELWTEQEVLDALAPIPAMVNEDPRCASVNPFEILRANGASAHQGLMTWTRRLIAASPGPAKFLPVEHIVPPPVIVVSTGALLMDIAGIIQHYGIHRDLGKDDQGNQLATLYSRRDKSKIVSGQRDGSLGERDPGPTSGDGRGSFERIKLFAGGQFASINAMNEDGTNNVHSYAASYCGGEF